MEQTQEVARAAVTSPSNVISRAHASSFWNRSHASVSHVCLSCLLSCLLVRWCVVCGCKSVVFAPTLCGDVLVFLCVCLSRVRRASPGSVLRVVLMRLLWCVALRQVLCLAWVPSVPGPSGPLCCVRVTPLVVAGTLGCSTGACLSLKCAPPRVILSQAPWITPPWSVTPVPRAMCTCP